MNSLVKSKIAKVKVNSKVQSGNTEHLQKRDTSICVNTMCDNTKDYPISTEFCPDCGKLLGKTVGSSQFTLV
jgi:hypothetical protein